MKAERLKALGKELRHARHLRGLRILDVAEAVDVSPSVVCHYELGEKEPPALRLLALAHHLRIDLRYLQRQVLAA
jgi:transcriptional regulator with XRE-family HTH domain